MGSRRRRQTARPALRKLVRHAARRSAFYREKYAGIDLDRFQLSDLPITNKKEITSRWNEVITDPQVRFDDVERFMQDPANLGTYYLGRYGVSHTSGSLGAPLTIVQDRHALEILFSMITARGSSFSKPGIIEGWHRLRSPARVAIVTWKRGFYPSRAAFDLMEGVVSRLLPAAVLFVAAARSDREAQRLSAARHCRLCERSEGVAPAGGSLEAQPASEANLQHQRAA